MRQRRAPALAGPYPRVREHHQGVQETADIGRRLGAKTHTAIGLHHLGLIALLGKNDPKTAVAYLRFR